MKTVYLLRHAKSSWDKPALPDPLRPLAARGRKAAPHMGAHMARSGFVPDLVLCSAARRARETWELVSESLGGDVPVEIREDLYHASPGNLLTVLQDLPASVDAVLLVGHNPTFEDLALTLAGAGEADGLERLRRKYPTGALVVLDFPTGSWSDVREGAGHLRAFIRPKDLQSV